MEKMPKPTVDQVREYMTQKMPDWPAKFCEWYADKFWNFYESKGWMVGKNQMTSWKAAFCNNFRDLKDDAHQKLLSFQNGSARKKPDARTPGVILDYALTEFSRRPTSFPREQLARYFDFLKQNGFLRFPMETKNALVSIFRQDPAKAKALSVEYCFESMINKGKTFSSCLQTAK